MTRGSIRRRGRQSWELKFDVPTDDGRRRTRYVTVRGRRQDAQRELTRQLAASDGGTFVDPSTVTVGAYVSTWLDAAEVAPKTAERYRELANNQVVPHLGTMLLQKLRPAHVQEWHRTLLTGGSRKGGPLSPRSVGHAHRLLRAVLQAAVRGEVLARNVAAAVSPPRLSGKEMRILTQDEVRTILERLAGHGLHTIAVLALGTGLRRGEMLALAWAHVDLDAARLVVERSLQQTADGLAFKAPKTASGRRTISLPASVVAVLRDHRRQQLETRVELGLGKPPADALVFAQLDGSPLSPDQVSSAWSHAVRDRKLPKVTLHALRHTHASALISAGLDVVAVSKRLGHSSPTVTLAIYAHLFSTDDTAAAVAIDRVLR